MPTAENVLIVQTYFVPASRFDAKDRYEVHVATDGVIAPLALVTRDVALYERALAVEGTSRRFDAAWRQAKSATGSRVQVLDSLAEREQ